MKIIIGVLQPLYSPLLKPIHTLVMVLVAPLNHRALSSCPKVFATIFAFGCFTIQTVGYSSPDFNTATYAETSMGSASGVLFPNGYKFVQQILNFEEPRSISRI